MPRVSVLTALSEFGSWERFQLSEAEWSKWGALAMLINPTVSGIAILVLGTFVQASGVDNPAVTPQSLVLSVVAGALFGFIVGAIPAMLISRAARAISRRVGYINGQLALVYAGLGVVLCTPIIGVFTAIVLPTVLLVTFLGWIWFRSSGGGNAVTPEPQS